MNKAIENAHREALRIKAQIEALTEEFKAHKTVLVTAGRGTHQTESGRFTVAENNTYDEAIIMNALTKGQFMKVSERKLSKPLVKILYPAIYASAKTPSEDCPFKVTV